MSQVPLQQALPTGQTISALSATAGCEWSAQTLNTSCLLNCTSFNVVISVSDMEDATHGGGLESKQQHRNKVMKRVGNVPQMCYSCL